MFLVIERGRFASGSDRHNAIDSSFDLPLDQTPQGSDIQLAIAEGSHEGGIGPSQHAPMQSRDGRQFKNLFGRRSAKILTGGQIRRILVELIDGGEFGAISDPDVLLAPN